MTPRTRPKPVAADMRGLVGRLTQVAMIAAAQRIPIHQVHRAALPVVARIRLGRMYTRLSEPRDIDLRIEK